MNFLAEFTQTVGVGYSLIVPIGIAVAVGVLCVLMHTLSK